VVSNDVFDEDDEGDRDVGQAAQGRQPTTLATLDIGALACWLEAEAPTGALS